jgi:hypothetical protein
MKRNIKILSILVLLLFAVSYATPFFAQENCDMPESTSSALHCEMDMSDMDCCEFVTECVTVQFYPISSAPINKVELQKDLTINYIVSYIDIFVFSDESSYLQTNNDLYCLDIHPGFQTPLLV